MKGLIYSLITLIGVIAAQHGFDSLMTLMILAWLGLITYDVTNWAYPKQKKDQQ